MSNVIPNETNGKEILKRKSLKRKIGGKNANAILIGLSIIAVSLTLNSLPDSALHDKPIVPYSPVWVLLNPLYTTQLPYQIYLAVFETIALAGMLFAVKNWGLPRKVALIQVFGLILISLMHWHQNITVSAFAWTAYFAWPLSLLVLQKLPFGWSLDLQDAHYKCLSECYTYQNGDTVREGWSNLFVRSPGHTINYVLMIILTLYPLVSRYGPSLYRKIRNMSPQSVRVGAGDKNEEQNE